jgi:hypothetical protein
MSKRTLLTSILCGLIAIAVQPMTAAATTPSLAGSWQLTLTPKTSTTPPVTDIAGLATFTTDGAVIETDGSEFVEHPVSTTPIAVVASPGHGIWQIANTPGTLFVQYFSLVFHTDGALYAKNVTTIFLTLNNTGNQFTGTYTTDQVIGSVTTVLSSGTISGQLIPHVPLP